jgi:hypothetical protein
MRQISRLEKDILVEMLTGEESCIGRRREIGIGKRDANLALLAARERRFAAEAIDLAIGDAGGLEGGVVGFRIGACQRQHGKAFALALGEALDPPHEDQAFRRSYVGGAPVEDGDRLEVGPVLEEDAAIAGAERMPCVGRDRETEARQPRARKRQRGRGKNQVVDRADSFPSCRSRSQSLDWP